MIVGDKVMFVPQLCMGRHSSPVLIYTYTHVHSVFIKGTCMLVQVCVCVPVLGRMIV